jgi:ADP-ribose pyrophosphatase YjhB (NUDIX family)
MCGNSLVASPPTRCSSCGTEHWNDAKPCAGALVVEHEQLLLVRRAHAPWKGRWDIPGGFCNTGEHPMRTAHREVVEETGLDVHIVGFLGMWLDEYDGIKRTLNIYYHAVPSGSAAGVHDPAEVAEIAWFSTSSLPDQLIDQLAFPGHILAALEAWKRAATSAQFVTAILDRPSPFK